MCQNEPQSAEKQSRSPSETLLVCGEGEQLAPPWEWGWGMGEQKRVLQAQMQGAARKLQHR